MPKMGLLTGSYTCTKIIMVVIKMNAQNKAFLILVPLRAYCIQ